MYLNINNLYDKTHNCITYYFLEKIDTLFNILKTININTNIESCYFSTSNEYKLDIETIGYFVKVKDTDKTTLDMIFDYQINNYNIFYKDFIEKEYIVSRC